MSAKRGKRESQRDMIIRLDTPEELFAVDPRGLLTGSGRLDSGIDELVDCFLGQKKGHYRRIVVDISDGITDERAENIEPALRNYCELRMHRASRQREVIWREGLQSLVSGSLLFVVGVLLSLDFTQPETNQFWQELLGNGVFLVIAWVGLWYPLDLLFIARQPLKREMRVLADMRTLPVAVRTSRHNESRDAG